MISAFGVEHISKSFTNLREGIAGARMRDAKTLRHITMDEKMRRHALEHRWNAGAIGNGPLRRMPKEKREEMLAQPYKQKYTRKGTRLQVLREEKKGAQGLYDRIGRNGRKNKVLP